MAIVSLVAVMQLLAASKHVPAARPSATSSCTAGTASSASLAAVDSWHCLGAY